jgi:hypothetical protein
MLIKRDLARRRNRTLTVLRGGENLTALLNRLRITCLNRSGSTLAVVSSGGGV